MLKDYKAVALKISHGNGGGSYTFIIKGNDVNEALINAQDHISNTFAASANYNITLELIGDSLIQ